MPRPLSGSYTELDDGRVKASLPVARGARSRRSATFSDRVQAEAWVVAGIDALQADEPLPDPADFRRSKPRRQPRRAASLETVRQAARHWHEQVYEVMHVAGPRRGEQVKADLDNHLFAFLDAIGIHGFDELTPEVFTDFARFLGGWPLHYHDFNGQNDRRLQRNTASRVLSTVRRFLNAMVDRGVLQRNPAAGVRAMEPYGGTRLAPVGAPLTLRETAQLAAHLSVIHQAALWVARLLGLRLTEIYGLQVGRVQPFDDYGLLAVRELGGRTFEERDNKGRIISRPSKDTPKTKASFRIVWVPPSLMELLNVLIDAFHTDPDTGEVDQHARLIPGIRTDDVGGANTFWRQLKVANERSGLNDEAVDRRIHPHQLRKSVSTELKTSNLFPDAFWKRFLGHVPGDSVAERHYLLDDPEHQELRKMATFLEQQVRDEVGSLMVPTSVTPTWGRQTRTRERLSYVTEVLELAGWLVPDGDDADPWLTPTQVGELLGMHASRARERMADGRIPAEQHPWGARLVWLARRSDILQLQRDIERRIELKDVAADRGMSYHEAYETLRRLDMLPSSGPHSQNLEITEEHVEALRAEQERVRELHTRSMRISEAAAIVPPSERSLRSYVAQGRLERDPETDSSDCTFVTRTSVEALRAELAPTAQSTPLSDPPEALSYAQAAEHTGLSRTQLKTLVRQGILTTVTVDRAAHLTLDSLRRWATGYRPDLIDAFGQMSVAS